jgi:hypothetical protein
MYQFIWEIMKYLFTKIKLPLYSVLILLITVAVLLTIVFHYYYKLNERIILKTIESHERLFINEKPNIPLSDVEFEESANQFISSGLFTLTSFNNQADASHFMKIMFALNLNVFPCPSLSESLLSSNYSSENSTILLSSGSFKLLLSYGIISNIDHNTFKINTHSKLMPESIRDHFKNEIHFGAITGE